MACLIMNMYNRVQYGVGAMRMGIYLNPGNAGFLEAVQSEYVDKTRLISLINKSIGTKNKLICISRPRRFGKSYAAQMLSAYYDCSVDSRSIFDELEISDDATYQFHINSYNVISLDVSGFVSECIQTGKDLIGIPEMISASVKAEVVELFPELSETKNLSECLLKFTELSGKKIVFIIDEWDDPVREAKDNPEAQRRYFGLLRSWFKNNNFTPRVVAAAYMTGILPIKKDGTESAVSDFREYSITEPGEFATFTGFTEKEVQELCNKYHRNFQTIKDWYDGYYVGKESSVYNPYSVMSAVESGIIKSYWKKTSAAETLITYIDLDEDGLQEDIARLIAGETIEVNTYSFKNDVENFASKDDVLTLLIHLGYLSYYEEYDYNLTDADSKPVGYTKIPNEEVRLEFEQILKKTKHQKLIDLVKASDQLLKETIAGNEESVAKAFSRIHDLNYAPTYYNDEQALRYVIRFAYLTCVDQYLKIEELPSGHGIADVVFLPKKKSPYPAMIIELKWNKSVDAAIDQIQKNNYPQLLKEYGGEVLLVGINYDEKSKAHSCRIQRIKK